jgi:hypothetical protein
MTRGQKAHYPFFLSAQHHDHVSSIYLFSLKGILCLASVSFPMHVYRKNVEFITLLQGGQEEQPLTPTTQFRDSTRRVRPTTQNVQPAPIVRVVEYLD